MSFSAPSMAIGYSAPRPRNSAWRLSAKRSARRWITGSSSQGLLHQRRQLDEARDEAALAFRVRAVVAGEGDDQHAQRGELRGEGLGRGDADLRSGARQHDELGLAHQRALRHVADGQRREVAGLLGEAQRGERVGGLARLRDGHEQRVRRHQRVAVAVLAGDVDRAGDLADLLDEVARHRGGMEARAAGDDVHGLRALEHLGGGGPERGLEQAPVGDALRRACRRGRAAARGSP